MYLFNCTSRNLLKTKNALNSTIIVTINFTIIVSSTTLIKNITFTINILTTFIFVINLIFINNFQNFITKFIFTNILTSIFFNNFNLIFIFNQIKFLIRLIFLINTITTTTNFSTFSILNNCSIEFYQYSIYYHNECCRINRNCVFNDCSNVSFIIVVDIFEIKIVTFTKNEIEITIVELKKNC